MSQTVDSDASAIKTFLIADIRGYTTFTQTFGDESAARLATRFAEITREVVEARHGSVVELRGDEALVVFGSAREAIRAAIDLQARFVEETIADPSLPLAVGIGLDAGEAVAVEGGYRGGALNLAARLCARAGPTEILASREVVHLGRKVEGVAQLDRPPVHLKGLSDPVQVVALRREDWSPEGDLAFRRALGASPAVIRRLDVANPYKGLRAFEEEDASTFFGREALTRDLVERLGNDRFLAVVGPSGSGKSSVVRAGLIPALREGAIPGSERWVIVGLLPGGHPLEELEAALLRVAANPPPSLIEQLERDEHGLIRAVKRVMPTDDSEMLLFIDQLEEVFTLVEDEDERTHFLSSIHSAVSEQRGQLRVVTTLRADFYDRPLLYRGFADLMGSFAKAVVPLSPDELEAAIVNPAKAVGAGLEPGLLADLLSEVASEPGALPLLQYALTELFDRREGNTLTLGAYREIGGVAGALAGRADEVFAGLTATEQDASRQLLLRLVTLGEGTEDTGRRVLRDELNDMEVDQSSLARSLEMFGASRLLSFDVDARTRRPTVEVGHEALLRSWGRLRDWIEAAREDVRMHRRLSTAAVEWTDAGRDPSFLLRGSRLEQLESWVGATGLALTGDERAYVQACLERREAERSEEAARQQRERALERRAISRLRSLVTVFSVLALVASALTVYSFRQRGAARRQSRIATARELAAAAIGTVASDPQLAVREAIQAVRLTKDVDGSVLPEAEAALHRTVQAQRLLLTIPRQEDLVASPQLAGVAWSPDGRTIATTSDRNTAKLWDAATGASLLTLEGHTGRVTDVAFSPDGSRIATASADRTARIWDTKTGRSLTVLSGHSALLASVAFNPDGRSVATAGWDGTTRIWDVESGRALKVLAGSGNEQRVAFSPDGTRVAAVTRVTEGVRTIGVVDIWDVASGKTALKLIDRVIGTNFATASTLVIDLAFDETGPLVAATGFQGGVLWDARTGNPGPDISSLFGFGQSGPLAFSPQGGLLAMGSVSGDTLVVATRASSGTRQVAGDEVLYLAGSFGCSPHRCPELGRPVTDLSFSPDGTRLAIVSTDGTTRIWDASLPVAVRPGESAGGLVRERMLVPASGEVQGHQAIAFSSDGSRVATAYNNGAAVWDVASGERILTTPSFLEKVFTVVDISPDGSRLATSPDRPGETAIIRDAKTGSKLLSLPGRPVQDLDFSPEGSLLATAAPDGAKLWDPVSGRQLRVLSGQTFPANNLSFSPDGRLLATGSRSGEVILWDPSTGARVATLLRPAGGNGVELSVAAVAFSPDSRRLAAASEDGRALIWDVASGKQVLTIVMAFNNVNDVAFSPDGTRLVLALGNGDVDVWDAHTGSHLFLLTGYANDVAGVAFSPDGRFLASISSLGEFRIDVMGVDDLIRLAESRVTRKLAPEECRDLLHLATCPPA